MGTPEEVVTDSILSDLYTTRVKIVDIDDGVSKQLKVCVPLLA